MIAAGVSRLIPVTGVTLPFISYGGSSILATFIALGLLLRAGDAATGYEADLQTSSTDLGVLGRLALVRRLRATGVFFSALIVALIANLTLVQVIQAPAYAANPVNTRGAAQEARQDRGSILLRDGTVVAESVPQGAGQGRYYKRVYPKDEFAANVVGYLSARYGRAGMEAAANDVLSGKRVFRSFSDLVDQAAGTPVVGNDVVLTLDPAVQRAAQNALSGYRGACVVFDPRTGAVLGMATSPRYDPNDIDKNWAKLQKDPSSPLVDRGRLSLYAPGSTFKVVTTTAGLSSGTLTAEERVHRPRAADDRQRAGHQLRGRRLRADHARDRAHQLREHLLRPSGGEDRRRHAGQAGRGFRLQQPAPLRAADHAVAHARPRRDDHVGDGVGRCRPARGRAREPLGTAGHRVADGAGRRRRSRTTAR